MNVRLKDTNDSAVPETRKEATHANRLDRDVAAAGSHGMRVRCSICAAP
jgi:hypothetical protein